MSDTAQAELEILASTPELHDQVTDLLVEHGFLATPGSDAATRFGIDTDWDDGSELINSECPTDVDDTLGTALVELGVSFLLTQESNYDDGTVLVFFPELGPFHATCGANGGSWPLVDAGSIERILERIEAGETVDVVAELYRLTGKRWIDRLKELRG